jgi:hypothetical protein
MSEYSGKARSLLPRPVDGKEVGRIGFYAPDSVIKGNMIDSITGFGFLYPKPK